MVRIFVEGANLICVSVALIRLYLREALEHESKLGNLGCMPAIDAPLAGTINSVPFRLESRLVSWPELSTYGAQ